MILKVSMGFFQAWLKMKAKVYSTQLYCNNWQYGLVLVLVLGTYST